MSRKWQPSGIKFTILTILVVGGMSAGLASFWPEAQVAMRQESTRLVEKAKDAPGREAQADYHLATWLDSQNHAAYAGLARTQILSGHADLALQNLERAGKGSEVEQLKVRTLIELGRYNEAANAADALTGPGRTTDDVVLAGLALALAGRPADESLVARLSSSEAAGRITRAGSGPLPLAAELYASGLLRSSSALLAKQAPSYQRNLLLAKIYYLQHNPDDLALAKALTIDATKLDPSSLEAHQLLAKLYRDLGEPDSANEQDVLIRKLSAGRP